MSNSTAIAPGTSNSTAIAPGTSVIKMESLKRKRDDDDDDYDKA